MRKSYRPTQHYVVSRVTIDGIFNTSHLFFERGYFYGPITFVSLLYIITSSRFVEQGRARRDIKIKTKRLFVRARTNSHSLIFYLYLVTYLSASLEKAINALHELF